MSIKTRFDIDDLVELLTRIDSLKTIKLVGNHDRVWMNGVCRITGCEVQALQASPLPSYDQPSFTVWRTVRPAIHVTLETEYQHTGTI